MAETRKIQVMIVDDHPLVREGLKNTLLITDDLELCCEAGNGQLAVAHCRQCRPDVILMDISMPVMDGLEATRTILSRHPDLKIVVLTSFSGDEQVQKALDAGALGYLLKNTPAHSVNDAIRSANAGELVLSPEATQALLRTRANGHKLGHDLSPREKEVLALMTKGLTNDEIGEWLVISLGTVRHHVSACISKLGAANRTHAVALAVKHGLTD